MNHSEKNGVQESVGNRTQVAKNLKATAIKDKLLLVAGVIICIIIAISGFLPKHVASKTVAQDEKQDNSIALHQNLDLINQLREKRQMVQSQSGYHGANPYHPPTLEAPKIESNHLSKEMLVRMNAPTTFFSISGETQTAGAIVKNADGKTFQGKDANSEFLNQQQDIASVSAKQLPHPDLTVPAGEMIPATLETAINSELAGMVRAITTRDIYALSANKLLIPKGSTLIGQFNSAVTQGQSRIFVIWNRLQIPNGIIVTLNSPSTDSIGRTGQGADYIDRHFFERFGSGVLLSVLGAYSATGGVNGRDEYNSLSQYRTNVAGNFQQAASQTLQQDTQTKPTLQVNQGTAINIFVAHDLDFYRVAKRI